MLLGSALAPPPGGGSPLPQMQAELCATLPVWRGDGWEMGFQNHRPMPPSVSIGMLRPRRGQGLVQSPPSELHTMAPVEKVQVSRSWSLPQALSSATGSVVRDPSPTHGVMWAGHLPAQVHLYTGENSLSQHVVKKQLK